MRGSINRESCACRYHIGANDAFTNGVVGVTGEDGGEAGDADERGGYHRHRRRVDAAKGWVLVPLDISDIS